MNGTYVCESISMGAGRARYILGEAIELDFFPTTYIYLLRALKLYELLTDC